MESSILVTNNAKKRIEGLLSDYATDKFGFMLLEEVVQDFNTVSNLMNNPHLMMTLLIVDALKFCLIHCPIPIYWVQNLIMLRIYRVLNLL